MKRVMIIGASAGQIPLIKKAKELGYYVAVADYNPNAIGIPLADEFYHASTIDEEAILAVAKIFKPDGIATMQTDMPMRAIAKVNEELGLCGIDWQTAINATDKVEMIKCFKRHGIASPWYYVVDNNLNKLTEKFTYPCVFKPVDNSASRGVCLVRSKAEVEQAFAYSRSFSRKGLVLAEEYLQGPEVSVEILVWESVAHVIAVTDKLTTGAPFFVEMGHKEPSELPEKSVQDIKKLAIGAVKAVGIQNGQGHVEIIFTKGGPKVVELGARLGGDFITSDLVPLSTGVDMLKETLQIACGENPDLTQTESRGSAIRFLEAERGIIDRIDGIEEAYNISGVQRIEFFKKVGDESIEVHNSLDRIGYVIAQAETASRAFAICENVRNMIKVVIRNV